MLMGGVSGSANADAAMQCKMLVPEMEKRGYSKGFSAAITAASSAVTPVIPPGINLIVYALIAGVSVGKVFMAGYVPGFFMAICLMITVHVISRKRGYAPSRERRASGREILHQAIDSIWALLFPFGIILGLRIGLFTPSEAGAVAVLYCIVVGTVCYHNLKLEHIPIILREQLEESMVSQESGLLELQGVHFFMWFNEKLLDEDALRLLVAEKEQQIQDKRAQTATRKKEYEEYLKRESA